MGAASRLPSQQGRTRDLDSLSLAPLPSGGGASVFTRVVFLALRMPFSKTLSSTAARALVEVPGNAAMAEAFDLDAVAGASEYDAAGGAGALGDAGLVMV